MTITARHALVTGSSRGIGRGVALKLAEHGMHVAVNYVKDEASAEYQPIDTHISALAKAAASQAVQKAVKAAYDLKQNTKV